MQNRVGYKVDTMAIGIDRITSQLMIKLRCKTYLIHIKQVIKIRCQMIVSGNPNGVSWQMYVSIMCLPSLLRCQLYFDFSFPQTRTNITFVFWVITNDMSKLGVSHNSNAVRASLGIAIIKRKMHASSLDCELILGYSFLI